MSATEPEMTDAQVPTTLADVEEMNKESLASEREVPMSTSHALVSRTSQIIVS